MRGKTRENFELLTATGKALVTDIEFKLRLVSVHTSSTSLSMNPDLTEGWYGTYAEL